jgi:ABC-type dipeptide/oligopeptide/nickel transport system permease subunit
MATIDKEELPVTEEFLLDEKTLREIETMKGAGQWSIVWRRIKKDKMGMLGFYIVLFLIAMAFVSWVLLSFDNWLTAQGYIYGNPHPGFEGSRNNLYIELWFPGMDIENPIILFQHPTYMDHANAKLPPSFQYPFGTDANGQDMLSRVFFGATVSLALGFIGQMTTVIIGTVLGSIAGFYGGIVDDILQRVIELLYSMPGFILMIFIIVLFEDVNVPGGKYSVVVIFFSLIGWGGTALIVRSNFFSLKEQDFVEAERALGASDMRIIFRHILPNSLAPIIIIVTLGIATTIFTFAALAFFGFGDPNAISWGDDLNRWQDFLIEYPWMPMFPALFIFFTVLGFNLLGDSLRDALDPRLKD